MRRPVVSPAVTRWTALGAVVVNVLIVITGGAVRLTGSGLGCPSWPGCTEESYEPTPELGLHGDIEWSNRLLTGVVGLVVLVAFLAAVFRQPRRRSLVWLAAGVLAGIPAQAVLGGITVLTGLNPWSVAGHFLLSMAIIATAYALWVRSGEDDGPASPVILPGLRPLVWCVVGTAAVVLVLGTLVTGSGPHAGDPDASRMGFDPAVMAQLHADAVFLLVGLSVATWLALRATGAPRRATRAAAILIGVELAQGAVGFLQHFTGLPVVLVALHIAGACLLWLAALGVWFATRERDATDRTIEVPESPAWPTRTLTTQTPH